MPSADDLVKFTIYIWFFFAFIADLALKIDQILVPFIQILQQIHFLLYSNFRTNLHSLHTQILEQTYISITYDTYFNTSSLWTFRNVIYISLSCIICNKKILLFFCTTLTILVQTLYEEQLSPYITYFNTELNFVHYLFPLIKNYITEY